MNFIKRLLSSIFGFLARFQPAAATKDSYNILIYTRKSIGDIVMMSAALRSIRLSYPNSRIVLCTTEWNRDICSRYDLFDEKVFVSTDVMFNRNIFGLVSHLFALRRQKFDIAYIFDSFLLPIYAFVAGIPTRIGYQYKNESAVLTHSVNISDLTHRVDNFKSILKKTCPIVIDEKYVKPIINEIQAGHVLFKEFQTDKRSVGLVIGGGVNPGQTNTNKQWPIEYFIELSKLLLEDSCKIYLLGGKSDQHLATVLIQEINNVDLVNLVGATSIDTCCDIINKLDGIVSNDTALMHISAAVGIPVVSLFGPTYAGNLQPLNSSSISIQSKYYCSPCYDIGSYRTCMSKDCMYSIHPTNVYAEISKIIHK